MLMKKSLIALAVAGALATPVIAQADATLYGSFRVKVEDVDNQALDLGDDSSRMGIKGDVDLGLEGTKGLFHWEAQVYGVDDADQGTTMGNRLMYVGATGDWGTALAGKQYHPHYLWVTAQGTSAVFNSADGATAEWNILGSDLHKRQNSTLAYISPVMSGFQVAAGAVVGANVADSTDDVDAYNIAAKYSANDLYLAASFGKGQNDSFAATKDIDTWGLAATYTIDALKLIATYEDREQDGFEADAMNLAAIYNLGDGLSVKGRYAEKDIDGADDEQTNWTAEVEQRLGQGRVYASYWAFDSEAEDVGGEADRIIVGYRVDF
jgi:predicted porin